MNETMSALVWNNDDCTISETCTSVVYADTVQSWTKVLASAAVLQNCAAHLRAHAFAESVGGHAGFDYPSHQWGAAGYG